VAALYVLTPDLMAVLENSLGEASSDMLSLLKAL
jgi:hypothetical protein